MLKLPDELLLPDDELLPDEAELAATVGGV